MSLHVLMIQNGWEELGNLLIPGWHEYCLEYGYKFVLQKDVPPKYLDVHHSFNKIHQCLEYFREHKPECLWLVDLDMMITNHRIPAQNFPSANHAITLTRDINGLNSASVFLNGFWSLKVELWLRTIISLRRFTTSEQHAMWQIQDAYDPDTFYYPQPSFNSIDYAMYPAFEAAYTEKQGQWRPGHLLVHLPGKSLQERLDLFPCYTPHIIR